MKTLMVVLLAKFSTPWNMYLQSSSDLLHIPELTKEDLVGKFRLAYPKYMDSVIAENMGELNTKTDLGYKSGTEVYKGGEVTYFGLVSFGGKRYQGHCGEGRFTQTNSTFTTDVTFKSIKYENDIMLWTKVPSALSTKRALVYCQSLIDVRYFDRLYWR